MGTASSVEAPPGDGDDTLLRKDGTVKHVGKLCVPGIANPMEAWPMSSKPYVFISHTGQDGVKPLLAGPTYWFLKHILGVDAFVDNRSMNAGDKIVATLAEALYRCTHALVFCSPSYLKRKVCVQELNTLMDRVRLGDRICVMPALWKIFNLDGYHSDVRDLVWIPHEPLDEIDYITRTLWPKLANVLTPSRRFDGGARQFEEYLLAYIDAHDRSMPPKFIEFASTKQSFRSSFLSRFWTYASRIKGVSVPSLSDSDDSSTGAYLIAGVAFSGCYMDDNDEWNSKVLKRKNHIESNLKYILKHGTVTYGDTIVKEEKRIEIGKVVAVLECEVTVPQEGLTGDVCREVVRAAKNIARLLREAGTTEDELACMMIGTAWQGSLNILLEGEHGTFCVLFDLLSKANFRLAVDDDMVLVDLTPAFAVRGSLRKLLSTTNETRADLLLFNHEAFKFLYPTSILARADLRAGGMSYDRWFDPDLAQAAEWLELSPTPTGRISTPDEGDFTPSTNSRNGFALTEVYMVGKMVRPCLQSIPNTDILFICRLKKALLDESLSHNTKKHAIVSPGRMWLLKNPSLMYWI